MQSNDEVPFKDTLQFQELLRKSELILQPKREREDILFKKHEEIERKRRLQKQNEAELAEFLHNPETRMMLFIEKHDRANLQMSETMSIEQEIEIQKLDTHTINEESSPDFATKIM